MEYVNVKERLPHEDCWDVVCKTDLGQKVICDFQINPKFDLGRWDGDLRDGERVLEWLDENPSAAADGQEAIWQEAEADIYEVVHGCIMPSKMEARAIVYALQSKYIIKRR